MIPRQLRHLVLGRRKFWAYVGIIFALKFGVLIVLAMAPQSLPLIRHFDTWLMFGLAFVVGARFADVRWPRWLGITLVILITLVAPVALVFLQRPRSTPPPANPLDAVPDLAWICSLALVVLLVVVGSKRSSAGPSSELPAAGTPTPGT